MRFVCFIICFALVGCSITRTKHVSYRDGLFYEGNSSKLINGKVTIPGGLFENIEGQTKGKIKEGKRTGLWTIFYPSGKILSKTNWVNNLHEGLATEWYENGQKKSEAYYKDDKEDGLLTNWYENGQKELEFYVKDGEPNGPVNSWYENGQKEVEGNSKDGETNGLTTTWYENGQIKTKINYKDGKLEGLATEWYENGQKKSQRNFKDHKLDGLCTSWYSNGNMQTEIIWGNGIIISCSVWKPNGEKCTSTKIDNGDGVIFFYNDEGQEVGKNYFKNGKELSF